MNGLRMNRPFHTLGEADGLLGSDRIDRGTLPERA